MTHQEGEDGQPRGAGVAEDDDAGVSAEGLQRLLRGDFVIVIGFKPERR